MYVRKKNLKADEITIIHKTVVIEEAHHSDNKTTRGTRAKPATLDSLLTSISTLIRFLSDKSRRAELRLR